MKLQIQEYKISELHLVKQPFAQEREKMEMNLQVAQTRAPESSNSFLIAFKIKLLSDEFQLELTMVFKFMADCEITDEFMNGPFPKINAPAIAFPYVRAYISNLTLQSGYTAVMLPSINFVELSKKQ